MTPAVTNPRSLIQSCAEPELQCEQVAGDSCGPSLAHEDGTARQRFAVHPVQHAGVAKVSRVPHHHDRWVAEHVNRQSVGVKPRVDILENASKCWQVSNGQPESEHTQQQSATHLYCQKPVAGVAQRSNGDVMLAAQMLEHPYLALVGQQASKHRFARQCRVCTMSGPRSGGKMLLSTRGSAPCPSASRVRWVAYDTVKASRNSGNMSQRGSMDARIQC